MSQKAIDVSSMFHNKSTDIVDRLYIAGGRILTSKVELHEAIKDLDGFVDFEIKSLELAIAKMEWDSKHDPDALAQARANLERFQQFRTVYQTIRLSAVADQIYDLIGKLESILGLTPRGSPQA